MTHHESEENYIIETITKHEPKAKDIKTETKPNWDMTFVFKVGRKTHRISLLNIDYERSLVDVKAPYVEEMKEYFAELDEATKKVRDKYHDFLEGYQDTVSDATKSFAVGELDKYFNLESDIGLIE